LPASIDSAHQRKIERMQKLSGAAFDRAYMKEMLSDHKKDVSEFRKQAKSAKDPDVKAFASRTLPTLEEHLHLAQRTDKEVKTAKR
jgi:putative membrane protein